MTADEPVSLEDVLKARSDAVDAAMEADVLADQAASARRRANSLLRNYEHLLARQQPLFELDPPRPLEAV